MNRYRGLLIACATLFVGGCGSGLPPITDCEPGFAMTPDCRFQNPEDLAVSPDGERLIVSQMGQMDGSRPGNLALHQPGGDIDVLFPTDGIDDDRSWGDASCPPPDLAAFSPHGIDLVQRADGRWMLLAVNHGGRESVEFFEVLGAEAQTSIAWRGCAAGPDNVAFNDVAGRADGGLYVTHMFPLDGQTFALLKGAIFGSDTGLVYNWQPVAGWSVVPGSNGPFPNGIALSADGQSLYVNMYLAGEVRKLDLASGEVVAVYSGGSPDNSTWASDGRLLVATHTGGVSDGMSCQGLESGSCAMAFSIVSLDPDDLTATTVVSHEGPPMGAATVALEHDGQIYLGTFAGDRITRLEAQQ